MDDPRAHASVLSFLFVCRDSRPSGWSNSLHYHDFWELLYITEGVVRAVTANTESKGLPGSIYIRPPRVQHQEAVISTEPMNVWVLKWIDPSQPSFSQPVYAFDTTGEIAHGLQWLFHLHGLVGPHHPMLDEVTRTLVYAVSRAAAVSRPNPFAPLIDYIGHHLSAPLTLPDLARIAKMSPSHLSHEFADHYGVTPMKYVRRCRLQHACRVLVQTNKTMRSIAQEIGLRDEFEMSRVFRRVMGIAPGSLRRQIVPEPLPPTTKKTRARRSSAVFEKPPPTLSSRRLA